MVYSNDMVNLIGERPFGEKYDDSVSFGAGPGAPVPTPHGIEEGMAGKGGLGQGVPSPGGIEEGGARL